MKAGTGNNASQDVSHTHKERVRYFSQYKYIDNELERLSEELTRWKKRCSNWMPAEGRYPMIKENMSDGIAQKITDRMAQAESLRTQIEELIYTLNEPALRLLMEYRYIDGLTFEKIAERLDCSVQWAQALHKKAVYNIAVE